MDIILPQLCDGLRYVHLPLQLADAGEDGLRLFGICLPAEEEVFRDTRKLTGDAETICLEHNGKHRRTGLPVRDVVKSAEGMGDGMDVADITVRERDARVIRAEEQMLPRGQIIAVHVR